LGIFFPRFSALRRIPEQAFGLKEYLGATSVSKTCDNEDSTPSLGDSEVPKVQHPPGDAIPEFDQALGDRSKVSAPSRG
jgi:hypothetical protein